MIQYKTFTDSLQASAEEKANRFLAGLDPSQYMDTKYSVITSEHLQNGIRHCILIIYRK